MLAVSHTGGVPVKVLVQNSLFHPHVVGGAEVSSLLLARELARRGWEVDALATTGLHTGERSLRTRPLEGVAGGCVYEAPSHGLVDLYSADGSMPRAGVLRRGLHHFAQIHSGAWEAWATEALERSGARLVHTNTLVGMTGAVWRAAHALGIPIVHTLRDYFLLCPRTTLLRSSGTDCIDAPLPCRILRSRKLRDSHLVDVVTGSSHYVLDRHLRAGAFRGCRTEVIANACESLLDAAPERDQRGLRVLYLGQLGEHKGVGELLDVAEGQLGGGDNLDVEFDFAGAGPLRARVEELATRYPESVRYHGVVGGEAKDRLLRQASVMVVPSIWNEPFGRTVLDGFSYGLPVIGARRGGISEIITDGVDGTLVEPAAAALDAALRAYALDPEMRRRQGEAAFARARDFSLERQIDRFEALFRSLVNS